MTTTVDLRSDTVTRPSPGMRAAMAAAPLGDDVWGDDPSVNALQEQLAGLLGFEAAMFVPSGTQSNLCAILAHCGRGDEYIVGQYQHTYRWEGGGAAVLGSVQPQPLENQPDGTLLLSDIEAAIKPDDIHYARTRLLALENTWSGKLLPMAFVQDATRLARERGLNTHLDGARLFNAAVAQAAGTGGTPLGEARRIAGHFDSVSVCLSKGLGAPVGSVLCGGRDLITRAIRIRKMAGGGMRQCGMLAAAGTYALDHQVDRLADDHALARRLAEGLQGIAGLQVEAPQTNIVFVDVVGPARARAGELVPYLQRQGVLTSGLYRLRFVTHLDVDAAGVDRAVEAVRGFFRD
jgi:threonine aldolase